MYILYHALKTTLSPFRFDFSRMEQFIFIRYCRLQMYPHYADIRKGNETENRRNNHSADQTYKLRRGPRIFTTFEFCLVARCFVRLYRRFLFQVGQDLSLRHVCERLLMEAETGHDV